MQKTFRQNSIAQFHAFCNLPQPQHPLISLIDYSKVAYPFDQSPIKWVQDFYTIGLKRNVQAKFNYGQQPYDFDAGVLSFIAPQQLLKIDINLDVHTLPTGWLLLIHPDFLWNTPLAKKIKSFDFFQYAVNEALFLSEKEENIIIDLLHKIEQEYQSNMDKFSQELIVAQLDLLLIYAERFYERQFITRKKSNFELLSRFEEALSEYFEHDNILDNGLPTVVSLAEKLHISPNYLSSVLRLHTQQSTQQHIQNKILSLAKEKLSTTHLSISEIAYVLGFEHPQSFSKFFKQKTNQTPLAFRQAFN